MSIAELYLAFMGFSALTVLWIVAFFVLDDFVLNGYFKKKLQKRFKVE
jgi:hypothetical protein